MHVRTQLELVTAARERERTFVPRPRALRCGEDLGRRAARLGRYRGAVDLSQRKAQLASSCRSELQLRALRHLARPSELQGDRQLGVRAWREQHVIRLDCLLRVEVEWVEGPHPHRGVTREEET